MLSKCGVGEDSRESLGQQGGQTSQLNKINSEYSLEQLMLKLKFQYLGHLWWRADSLGKALNAGKDWGKEEKEATESEMVGWHHHSMNVSLSWLQETVKDREACSAVVHGVTKIRTWLGDWTTTKSLLLWH